MGKSAAAARSGEQTPVDDVRRVRRRLSREAGGDIHKQMQESRRLAAAHKDSLGLKGTGVRTVRGRLRVPRLRAEECPTLTPHVGMRSRSICHGEAIGWK